MKALVKQSAGRGITLTEIPEPRIRDDEVLIRVRSAGVCGTDVHIYEWDAWAAGRCKPPFVVGHEFAGDVVTVALTDAAPHFLSGESLSIRRTRGGDAYELLTAERKSEPLLLGMPVSRP